MKITLINAGITSEMHTKAGIELYLKRIGKYVPVTMEDVSEYKTGKGMPVEKQKDIEGKALLKNMGRHDL